MIHIRVKILFFLILLLFFSACTYNYEKEIIENNKNHLNIIIKAKSLSVNKVSLKNINNNNNDDIRKINAKLIDEFEDWLYKKFELQGNENEASIKIN